MADEQANDIKTYYYPSDLLSENEKYSKSYVVFYISAMKDTYASRNNETQKSASTVALTPVESLRAEGQSITVPTSANTISGGFGEGLGDLFGGLGLGTVFSGLSSVLGSLPNISRSNKQLVSAIALYTPNQLNIRHSAQWTETTAQIKALIDNVGGSYSEEGIFNAMSSALSSGGGLGASMALQHVIPRTPFIGEDLAGSISTGLGVSPNPKKEQMFQNMDFINFQLEFLFSPRNESEAKSVKDIIHQFKYHMHPEFAQMGDSDMGGFLYRYPSEFDIIYYYDDKINQNIHRHSTSILVDMNINYSPNGVYSVFPNGLPTQTQVILSFRELIIRTKQIIDAEFQDDE